MQFSRWTRLGALLTVALGMVLAAACTAQASRIRGIDVSHWQGSINWNSVRNDGIRFAFAKASQATSYQDPRFTYNMTQGVSAGVWMGAYHFANPADYAAAAEAQHFVNTAGAYMTNGYLRPVLDLEDGSELSRSALSNWTNTFLDTVYSLTGVEPLIYLNTYYSQSQLDSSVAHRDIWIANWGDYDPQTDSPPTGVFSDWAFWQYSSTGSVAGISGNVDLDVAHGDMDDLRQYVIPEPGTAVLLLGLGALALALGRRRSATVR